MLEPLLRAGNVIREAGARVLPAVRHLAGIIKLCGSRPFGTVRICLIGSKAQPYIVYMYPLLELIRRGFEPGDEEHTGGPIIEAPQASRELVPPSPLPAGKGVKRRNPAAPARQQAAPGYTPTLSCLTRKVCSIDEFEAFEKAIKLGLLARDKKWTEERLKDRFKLFLAFGCDSTKPARPAWW